VRRILDAEFDLSGQTSAVPASIDETLALLGGASYVGDRALATVIFLSLRLGRPLFLEGEAGVGKTEIAKVLAASLGRKLIRLQCYEGLDVANAVYEWNYPAQMMAIRLAEASGEHDKDRIEHDIFSERYLIKRPLLQALEPGVNGAPVLLIDEIDRADSEFEAFLLEFLSDFQITIPELGTVRAGRPPVVVLTSNRTRELHDALKRRCLYHWIPFPDAERERRILRAQAPGLDEAAAGALVAAITNIRALTLLKRPGIAETIDWAQGAAVLTAEGARWPEALQRSLGLLLKDQEDFEQVAGQPQLFAL
jgi:MoxR-like ATPase